MALQTMTIISGGQLGCDVGALEAAMSCFPQHFTDGYMPKGFDTELGPRPDIAQKYGLKESDGGYATRDKQNVDMSDALVAFLLTLPETGRGTTCTVRYAQLGQHAFMPIDKPTDANHLLINSGNKPILVIWLADAAIEPDFKTSSIIRDFLFANPQIKRLMVSGPCESTLVKAGFTGSIQEKIKDILRKAIVAPQVCFPFKLQ